MSKESTEGQSDMEPTPGEAAAMHDEWLLTEEGRRWYDEHEREKNRVW